MLSIKTENNNAEKERTKKKTKIKRRNRKQKISNVARWMCEYYNVLDLFCVLECKPDSKSEIVNR